MPFIHQKNTHKQCGDKMERLPPTALIFHADNFNSLHEQRLVKSKRRSRQLLAVTGLRCWTQIIPG